MPIITKIFCDPIGEFTIKFSTRYNKFLIELPINTDINKVGKVNSVDTWKEVIAECDRINEEYQYKVTLLRKVIVIKLKTSASPEKEKQKATSNYTKWNFGDDERMKSSQGFEINWWIADEFKYKNSKKYKVTECGKNSSNWSYENSRIDFISKVCGDPVRVLDYREDLHVWFKNLDVAIDAMLQQLIKYFDPDPDIFIYNFENNELKFLPKK